jgi:hypothetical protein
MAGLVGIAALARFLARRRRHQEATSTRPPAVEPDPADELRRKLSETRESPATGNAPELAAPEEPAGTLDERRSRVHAKAQEAIEAMHDPPQ